MSQTPWPYPQQNPYPPVTYYGPAADPYRAILAPARRAAIFVLIIAGLMSLCGVAFGAIGLLATPEMIGQAMQGAESAELPPQMMRMGFALLGCGTLVMGLGLLISGIFVWRGSGGAIITAIVLTVICLIVSLLSAAASASHLGHMSGPSDWLSAGCTIFLAPLLMMLMLVMLIRALKSVRMYRQAYEQYQAQYWQYQQAQQMYQQPGPAPVQSPPPSVPPDGGSHGPA